MPVRKVQLINAPNDERIVSSGGKRCYPHLGLLSIATLLQRSHPSTSVEVIDGSVTPLKEILSRLDADVVGISVLTLTYANALAIAAKAKEQDSYVVFGNDHASNLASLILKNRHYVDGVVRGDCGEISFAKLMEHLDGKCDVSDVPNYVYREECGSICETASQDFPLGAVPIPDRSLLEKAETYQQNYEALHGEHHSRPVRTTSVNIARGCGWGRVPARRCLYCDILDLKLKHLPAERVWREVAYLQDHFGITSLFEVCDSFTSLAQPARKGGPIYLKRLLQAKLPHVNPEWFIYGRAQEITPESVSLLKQLNVSKVSIGVDSGDDRILRSLGKGNPNGAETNLRAARLLAGAGISLVISIVLGSPGETEESLQSTVRHVKEIARAGNLIHATTAVLLPMPGSRAWRMMMDRDYATRRCRAAGFTPKLDIDFNSKYGQADILSVEPLLQDWVQAFCLADYETINDCMNHIQGGRNFFCNRKE